MKAIEIKNYIYADRHEAGATVAQMLEKKYKDKHVLVLGIPRGGVVIAYEVARRLHGELSVVVTKKLPHPEQEELAVGAMAEDGSVFLTSLAREVREEVLRDVVCTQRQEILRRVEQFRHGKALPAMENRIVILADDGIATGSTLVPAIQLCRKKKAAVIVVAAPVSGEYYVSEIDDLADEVVIAQQPEGFQAVGQVYDDFRAVEDEEVLALLK
ncbi:phosphoribosyltransferase [Dawidia soli]|uniref:Phosphoribosyltransferase n=1 Tax=Dawidia soli TaxID=2782352 RepID=A0AAP2DDX8_9BACT|nr:phosphoribosyltransferase family protein [Dawidia soli]MBT1690284.1 phosphoribosyltransferase [Dawidia soli]